MQHHDHPDPATFGLFLALTRVGFDRDEADDLTDRLLRRRDNPKRNRHPKRDNGPHRMLTFRECEERYPGMFLKPSGKPKDSAYKIADDIGKRIGRPYYIREDKLDAYMEETAS